MDKRAELEKVRKGVVCGMCGGVTVYEQQGDTHIYVCEACPFLALEYFNRNNLTDLTDYINRT